MGEETYGEVSKTPSFASTSRTRNYSYSPCSARTQYSDIGNRAQEDWTLTQNELWERHKSIPKKKHKNRQAGSNGVSICSDPNALRLLAFMFIGFLIGIVLAIPLIVRMKTKMVITTGRNSSVC